MSDDPSRFPSEADLDRLLASQPRRTSPDFEMRWRELRATFGQSRAPSASPWRRWWMLPGLATAALAALALVLTLRLGQPPPRADLLKFEELIALDAALSRATPLLDAENRDALLHLPAEPRL